MDEGLYRYRSLILHDALLALIYFTLQNEENQEAVVAHAGYSEIVKSVFSMKQAEGMLEMTFIFLSQIYKDNYSILLSLANHFAKQGKFLLKSLFANFFDHAGKQELTFAIYFFQFLKYFFTINGKNIL